MRLTLEVHSEIEGRRTFTAWPGPPVRIGRKAPANFILPGDPSLSRVHFSVGLEGDEWRMADMNSTCGTSLNGIPITEAVLQDGDVITAGATTFLVQIDILATFGPTSTSGRPTVVPRHDEFSPAETIVPPVERGLHDRVLDRLRAADGPLFAILDAARDPLILARLQDCKEEHESLYEGVEGQKLMAFAPYLVALPRNSPFLESLVRDGWGKSWGIYLTCTRPFKDVRKHFRHFLIVELEKDRKVYFRFYDPRVLRVYLPTCTTEEHSKFFGPLQSFLMEDEDPEILLSFRFEAKRFRKQAIKLMVDGEAATALPSGLKI